MQLHTGSFNRETLYDAAGYLRQQARHFYIISTSRPLRKNRLSKRKDEKGKSLKEGVGLTTATTDKGIKHAPFVPHQWFLIHPVIERRGVHNKLQD